MSFFRFSPIILICYCMLIQVIKFIVEIKWSSFQMSYAAKLFRISIILWERKRRKLGFWCGPTLFLLLFVCMTIVICLLLTVETFLQVGLGKFRAYLSLQYKWVAIFWCNLDEAPCMPSTSKLSIRSSNILIKITLILAYLLNFLPICSNTMATDWVPTYLA